MGLTIERERFDPADYQRFEQRLEECLVALGRLLERPAFGRGQATVGAELELSLVNDKGRALPRNQEVRAETADPRVVLEIDRFNLELNLTPAPLAGQAGGSRGSPLGPAGPGPGRWSCWRRASGCTSRYCRWSAPSSRLTASTRATGSRPSRSCGCTRGRCGAGTGPSLTRPTVDISASRCRPCRPGRP